MTDNEIIKALECCCGTAHDSCRDCPYDDIGCEDKLEKDALDFINRQKAEIERLEAEYNDLVLSELKLNKTFMCFVNKEKSEAVKEFAELIKKTFPLIAGAVDYMAKEMVGKER